MNEFWALILGSALGVFGGVLGTLFTNWLNNKNEIKKEKKLAYFQLLKMCRRVSRSITGRTIPFEEVLELEVNNLIYASGIIIEEYDKIIELIQQKAKLEKSDMSVDKINNKIQSHTKTIIQKIKEELKIE